MTQPKPRLKFTVDDYRTTPEDKRYQLLNGDLILAPSPTNRHQTISAELYSALRQFINENRLGHIWYAPFDVFLSDYDVAQPDILFVSSQRSEIITEANIQGGISRGSDAMPRPRLPARLRAREAAMASHPTLY